MDAEGTSSSREPLSRDQLPNDVHKLWGGGSASEEAKNTMAKAWGGFFLQGLTKEGATD